MEETKVCNRCGDAKLLDDFHAHPLGRQGRQAGCKKCLARIQKERYDAMTPEQRAWRMQRVKLYKYGLTVAQYEAMREAQGNRCAVCGQPEPRPQELSVDHDHVTGAVRALLCNDCNVGLGLLGEDPERLEAAATYLRRFH